MTDYPRNFMKISKIAKERGIDPNEATGPGKVAKIIALLEADDEIRKFAGQTGPPAPPEEPEPPEKDEDLPAPGHRNPFPEPNIEYVTLHRRPNTVMRMPLVPLTADQRDVASYVLEKVNLALRLRQKCSIASPDNFYDVCLRPSPNGDPDEFSIRLRTHDAHSTRKSCYRHDKRFVKLPPQGHYND